MNQTDKQAFTEILETAFQAYQRPTTAAVVTLWWNLLQDVPIEDFAQAITQHMNDPEAGKYAPMPAHIRAHLQHKKLGAWPSPEEAWNLCPKREEEGGWLCQEMAAALGACADSLSRNDYIAARKAFVEVYERALHNTHEEKPTWWYSEMSTGSYEQRLQAKADAMLDAEHRGILPPATARATRVRLLERMTGFAPTTNGLQQLATLRASTSLAKRPPSN